MRRRGRATGNTIALAALLGACFWPFWPGLASAACETRVDALPVGTGPLAIGDAPRPALGQSAADASHGTCVRRLTDHRASGAGRFMRTLYSRSQAFNADGTRALVYGEDGRWRTVDVATSKDLGIVPGISGAASEPQWHASDPALLYFFDEGGGERLRRVNVVGGDVDTVADFSGRTGWPGTVRLQSGSSGSPSADQRRWAFVAQDASGRSLGIVVWDAVADAFTARLDFAERGLPPTDTVSMSPGGGFVVAEWGAPQGVRAWRANLAGPGVKLNAKEEHSDLARLGNGNDAYVSVDFDSSGQGFYVDLDRALADGRAEPVGLFDIYPGGSIHSMHFSGKAYDRPGWALVSTYAPRRTDPNAAATWMERHVFAVELVPGGRSIGIAHDRVRALRPDEGKVYFAEPHASASRDFAHVAWNSNWGAADALDVDAYAVTGLDWSGVDGGGCPAGATRSVPPRAWVLLGLPCRAPAGATVEDVFGDDVDGGIGTDWVLYTFDTGANAYARAVADTPAPPPGQGFWFIHANAQARTLDMPSGSASGDAGAALALAPSALPSPWRLIGNPAVGARPAEATRVSTRSGPCGGAGCTLEGARNSDVLGDTPAFYDEAGGEYLPFEGARALPAWGGLWASTGPAGDGLAPSLRFAPGR